MLALAQTQLSVYIFSRDLFERQVVMKRSEKHVLYNFNKKFFSVCEINILLERRAVFCPSMPQGQLCESPILSSYHQLSAGIEAAILISI